MSRKKKNRGNGNGKGGNGQSGNGKNKLWPNRPKSCDNEPYLQACLKKQKKSLLCQTCQYSR